MKCPKCQATVKTAYHKWGSHGEDLYKCPSCSTMLTHKRSFGSFLLVVIILVPVLTALIEFVLTAILHPVIENTRFEDSNRFVGISVLASLVAAYFILSRFSKLVVYEDKNRFD